MGLGYWGKTDAKSGSAGSQGVVVINGSFQQTMDLPVLVVLDQHCIEWHEGHE